VISIFSPYRIGSENRRKTLLQYVGILLINIEKENRGKVARVFRRIG